MRRAPADAASGRWPFASEVGHGWEMSPAEARSLQRSLAERIRLVPDFGRIRRIAGVDVGFEDGGRITRASVVVHGIDGLAPLEHGMARQPTRFPYVPGLLSFREAPAVLAALESLTTPPDLLLCDGQGIAHPRRLGIACHLGLLAGLPSIGVAKSRLVGRHEPVPEAKGGWTPLMDGAECIGAVLRTRSHVRPVYVSPGHRMDLPTAIDYTMRCVTRYRLPEPIRAADRASRDS